jgi:NADH-quinone oxidoreductase subunit E
MNDAGSVFTLPSESVAEFDNIVERYPTKASALMPVLWLIQDSAGFISDDAVVWISEKLEVTQARIREVISFYFMYRDTPQAKYTLQVCHNISCHIMKSRSIMTHIGKQLGVKPGEQTGDGMFALEGVECLGACGMGPVMQVGSHLYEELTIEKVDAIIEGFRSDQPVTPDTDRKLEG